MHSENGCQRNRPKPLAGGSSWLIFVLLLTLLGAQARPAEAADIYKTKYEVAYARVLAEGKWHNLAKKTAGQFVAVFKPSWPLTLPVEVTWKSISQPTPSNNNCYDISSTSLPLITVSKNGQPQPGHPTIKLGGGGFTYVFQNVPRSPPTSVNADCTRKPDAWTTYSASGGATITFQPEDPLSDWDPGLPKDSSFPLAAAPEISQPIEGAILKPTEPLRVFVKLPGSSPRKWSLEVEKALDVQTGVVGDIALPGNKPYATQWKPMKTLSFESAGGWVQFPGSLRQTPLQTLGTLGTQPPTQHEPGLYRIRARLSAFGPYAAMTSQWRNFQVPSPPRRLP